ncbi:MAG: hypothetical protein U0324_23945 [Polyangiales bacterium]
MSPASQAKPHTPALQVAVVLGRVGQTLPQRPQCEGDVLRLTSQPLTSLPSQLPNPALQSTPQVDAAQVAVALAGTGQAYPHAPQCIALVDSRTHAPPQFRSPAPQLWLHAPDEHT